MDSVEEILPEAIGRDGRGIATVLLHLAKASELKLMKDTRLWKDLTLMQRMIDLVYQEESIKTTS